MKKIDHYFVLIQLLGFLFFGIDRFLKGNILSANSERELFSLDGYRILFSRYLNSDMAFSLPFPVWLIIGVTLVILGILMKYLLRSWQKREFALIAFQSLIIWGAFSNLWDRLVYGAVVDYVLVELPFFKWPVFNVADGMVVMGVLSAGLVYFWQSTSINKKRG